MKKLLTALLIVVLAVAFVSPALAGDNRSNVNIISDRNSAQFVASRGIINRNYLYNGGNTANTINVRQRGYRNRSTANIISDRNSLQEVMSEGLVNRNTLINTGTTTNRVNIRQNRGRRFLRIFGLR